MKRLGLIKRIISIIITAALALGITGLTAFGPFAQEVLADTYDGYHAEIKMRVYDSASGWNSPAKLKVTGTNREGTVTKSFSESGLEEWFCEEGTYSVEFDMGKYFPTMVSLYTDFGGAVSWRELQLDLTLYVNGVNVTSRTVDVTSSIFDSSDTWTNIEVDSNYQPYPKTFDIRPAYKDDIYDFDFYEMFNTMQAEIRINAWDQYGVSWYVDSYNADPVFTSLDFPDTDYQVRYEGYSGTVYTLTSTLGIDHKSRFKATYTTNNTIYPTVDFAVANSSAIENFFEIKFIFNHTLEVQKNGEFYTNYKGSWGEKTRLDNLPSEPGYHIKSYSRSGFGTYDEDLNIFMFDHYDAVLNFILAANKYTVTFDGNGADGSSAVKDQTMTYDRSAKLNTNKYTRRGYTFAGWNTMPDGSGTAYSNGERVVNLAGEDGAVITLYAQWTAVDPKVVALVYPEETGLDPEEVIVPSGYDVPVDMEIDSGDGQTHFTYVSADKPITGITEDQVITLSYERENHSYSDPVMVNDVTCTEDGRSVCTCSCGSQYYITYEALGHDCLDEWEWDEDRLTSASVTLTCKRCEQVQTFKPRLSYTDTTEDGLYYRNASASLEYSGKTYESSRTKRCHFIQFDLNEGLGSIPDYAVFEESEFAVPEYTALPKQYCTFEGWLIGDKIYQPGDILPVGNYTMVAQWGMSWSYLQELLSNKGIRTVKLQADVTALEGDVSLKVDHDVILDLNGYTLDRACTGKINDGSAITVSNGSRFQIIDSGKGKGMIRGGSADCGGGVQILGGSSLTMDGGVIAFNEAKSGGGIYVAEGSSLRLWGGVIRDNVSDSYGGAICCTGYSKVEILYSPQITNNAYVDGIGSGGIFMESGTLEIGRSDAQINNNYKGDGSRSNVALYYYAEKINITGALGSNTKIGVSGAKGTVMTTGLKGNGTVRNFVSDNSSLSLSINGDGELVFADRSESGNNNDTKTEETTETETSTETETETEPEMGSNPYIVPSDPGTGQGTQSEETTGTGTGSGSSSGAGSGSSSGTGSGSSSGTGSGSSSGTGSGSSSDSGSGSSSDSGSDGKSDSGSDSKSDSGSDNKSESETETETEEPEYYTINFMNDNGTLIRSYLVKPGKTPSYKRLKPSKAAGMFFTYTFAGWDPEITPASKDTFYTAAYTAVLRNGYYESSASRQDLKVYSNKEEGKDKKALSAGNILITVSGLDLTVYSISDYKYELLDEDGNAIEYTEVPADDYSGVLDIEDIIIHKYQLEGEEDVVFVMAGTSGSSVLAASLFGSGSGWIALVIGAACIAAAAIVIISKRKKFKRE